MKTAIRAYAAILALLQIAIVRELQAVSVFVARYVKETLPAGIDMGVVPNMATYWPALYYAIPAVTLVAILDQIIMKRSERHGLHVLGASITLFLVVMFFHVVGIVLPYTGLYGRIIR